MGTIISARHLNRIEAMVKRATGKVIAGGSRMTGSSPLDGFDLSTGSFFPPTVVTDVDTKDELWQEEVFGPVVVMKRFTVRKSSTDGKIVTEGIRRTRTRELVSQTIASTG